MALVIRLATAQDARGVAEIYGPVVAGTATSFESDPPDEAEMARRIQATLPQYPWLVCAEGEFVAGYAYGSRHRARQAYQWSVETTVYIHAGYRGRGVGRALYESLLAILKAQGFGTAFGGMTVPNPASAGLHRAAGFEPVGVFHRIGHKFGAWHDVAWFERRLRADAPGVLRTVDALQREAGWDALLTSGLAWLRTK